MLTESKLIDFCDLFIGKYTEEYYNLYKNSKLFKKYIDENYLLYNSSEYNSVYKIETQRYIPTLYELEGTFYHINGIRMLLFYYHSKCLFLRGTDSNIYLKKKFISHEQARIFLDSLVGTPITPNVVRQFELIKNPC